MTIELQESPLPHDIQYVLDSALENDDINAFDHLVVTLFADRAEISELLDKKPEDDRLFISTGRSSWKNRMGALYLEVDRRAHALADQLDKSDQKSLVAASLIRERPRLIRLAECYAGWNYTDSTIGGDLRRFRRRVRLDRQHEPVGQVRRRLQDQRSIAHYVRSVQCDSTDHARSLADGLRTRRPWPDSPTEADGLQHYLDEQGRRHRESYARAAREFISKAERRDKKQKQRRRAVVRSAAAAETILGRGSVMTLARGEPIFLEGSEFTFRVAVRHLVRAGHGGMDVSLESRGGQRLADLCLYFEGTPALEQAAAVALHIQSGDELDLLLTGNPFNVTAAGASHPLVADRLAQRRDETRQAALDLQQLVDAAGASSRVRQHLRGEITRAKCADYVLGMTPRYLEPLIDRVWVDAGDRLRDFSARISST